MENYSNAVLLLIDVQVGIDSLFDSPRCNPQAEDNIASLLSAWRTGQRQVIHVKHNSTSDGSPLRPELAGNAFKPEAIPVAGEPVFEKTVNSAFIGTDLEAYLQDKGIKDLVIVGLTTDHCVSTTTRMAGNLGFNVVLISDATATFGRSNSRGEHISADQVHEVNLLSLDGEFCRVMTTQEVLQTVR